MSHVVFHLVCIEYSRLLTPSVHQSLDHTRMKCILTLNPFCMFLNHSVNQIIISRLSFVCCRLCYVCMLQLILPQYGDDSIFCLKSSSYLLLDFVQSVHVFQIGQSSMILEVSVGNLSRPFWCCLLYYWSKVHRIRKRKVPKLALQGYF